MSRSRSFTAEQYQAMYYHEEAIVNNMKPLLRARTHETKASAIYNIKACAEAWLKTYNEGIKEE